MAAHIHATTATRETTTTTLQAIFPELIVCPPLFLVMEAIVSL